MFYIIVVTHKLMTKMWYLIFYFSPQSYTLCSISTINTTMLVSVFETAAFCLYSDIFKTKIASKSQILKQTSKFYFSTRSICRKKNYYYFLLPSLHHIFLSLYFQSVFLYVVFLTLSLLFSLTIFVF